MTATTLPRAATQLCGLMCTFLIALSVQKPLSKEVFPYDPNIRRNPDFDPFRPYHRVPGVDCRRAPADYERSGRSLVRTFHAVIVQTWDRVGVFRRFIKHYLCCYDSLLHLLWFQPLVVHSGLGLLFVVFDCWKDPQSPDLLQASCSCKT